MELGFWIPIISGISDSLWLIPDFKAQDSGLHEENFPDSRLHKQNISRISESRLPCMGRLKNLVSFMYKSRITNVHVIKTITFQKTFNFSLSKQSYQRKYTMWCFYVSVFKGGTKLLLFQFLGPVLKILILLHDNFRISNLLLFWRLIKLFNKYFVFKLLYCIVWVQFPKSCWCSLYLCLGIKKNNNKSAMK